MALNLDSALSRLTRYPADSRSRRRRRAPPAPVVVFSSSSDLRVGSSSDLRVGKALAPSQKLVIAGGRQLSGHIHVSGSKNAALAILAGALCCSRGVSVLRGVPAGLADVEVMMAILRSLGTRIEVSPEGGGGEQVVVRVEAGDVAGKPPLEPCAEAVGRIRAGFFVVGPLLGRFGEVEVAWPGGCEIGARPVDIYVEGLRSLGAVIELRQGKLCAHAANGKGLVGSRFYLHFPSVGASQVLMMAASLAEGRTVLSNVAREPEVLDLANFLIACGAQIEGAGTHKLVIHGRKQLYGTEYNVIPDRIEAGTLMVAAAITRSCVSLSPVIPHHLTSAVEKLSASGCRITQTSDSGLEVSALYEAGGGLQGFNFRTSPFPGFPTDLQPQFMSLLTTCNGASMVEECVFEGRMRHVEELRKLGAKIQVSGSTAMVTGNGGRSGLRGSPVTAMDLRGGASLVLAGLAAEGVTEVRGVAHIDRGYEHLETKLRHLGADITRLEEG